MKIRFLPLYLQYKRILLNSIADFEYKQRKAFQLPICNVLYSISAYGVFWFVSNWFKNLSMFFGLENEDNLKKILTCSWLFPLFSI